jgi:hypothetical protein
MLVLMRPADAPHPFAVLFAQAFLTGTAFAGVGVVGLGFVLLAARVVQIRRGTRHL